MVVKLDAEKRQARLSLNSAETLAKLQAALPERLASGVCTAWHCTRGCCSPALQPRMCVIWSHGIPSTPGITAFAFAALFYCSSLAFLSLRFIVHALLPRCEKRNDDVHSRASHAPVSSYMLEATPYHPFGGSLLDFLAVERNMTQRRKEAREFLPADECLMSLTNFPRYVCVVLRGVSEPP